MKIDARFVPVLAVLAFMICALQLNSQITYTKSFTRQLERASLTYHLPVERWMHVTPTQHDEFMRYTLVLQNDRNDFEIRYRIKRVRGSVSKIPVPVETSRLLTHIASNADDSEVRVVFPDDETLQEVFGADAGVVAYFTPKATFSEKPHGALLTLYGENKAIVDVVLLYHAASYDPLDSFRSLSFVDEEE